ncbi:PREDICTED: protein MEI2-like 5 [Ipomoea nil]|uniref:protein MEI2-like 5 n=1 Tax=Ipomoea nil TaxID=35883 RepID=UPI000900A2A0|nr:PREDICTED: protein MEI2-like 5 [Ipomoea nil]
MNTSKEKGSTAWRTCSGSDCFDTSTDASLFSSSLPVLSHERLNLSEVEHGCESSHDAYSLKKIHQVVESNDLLGDDISDPIRCLLPDDEDALLAGVMDGFDTGELPNCTDDLEEYDIFGNGGGLELESDFPRENLIMGASRISLSDTTGVAHCGLSSGGGAITGEHPLGEHPSRTLFVRNINSNVEDSELRTLFEQYGDIRTMYTACKHRGFVMISYYDIRAARTAMRALQNKPLRRRKLDIHFSIPKDNPSEKDMNQGTLVIFNLDPSVSNDDLLQIFGSYGEIKEIRETPHKRHHKFIEYYDVRAAEAALRSLNRSDIAGKRIKLEPSRPGGTRRNLMLQLNQDLEQDECRSFTHQMGSLIGISPPGNWPKFGSPIGHGFVHNPSNSPGIRSLSPTTNSNLNGLASLLHSQGLNSTRVAPIGKDQARGGLVEHLSNNGNSNFGASIQQPHSFPEPKLNWHSGPRSSYGASSSNGSGIETLSGQEFLWGSPKLHSDYSNSSWQAQPMGHAFISNGQEHWFPSPNHHGSFLNSSQHHNHPHAGSAPSSLPVERHLAFFPDSLEASHLSAFSGIGIGHNDRSYTMNAGPRGASNSGVSFSGSMSEYGSPRLNIMSSQRPSPVFPANAYFPGSTATDFKVLTERGHSQHEDVNDNQIDNKKFQLDLDKIRSGKDTRTTLMIKNIPNKYTSKMLLAAIDEHHKGSFDFLYLPIDFKNKCNVGYAFINMLSPLLIIPLFEAFNGKKWEKFNSEKVVLLAYARIQGKEALVAHFQNSSLMNEDKRCRPLLFHPESSDSSNQIVQEHRSSSSLSVQIHRSNESKLSGSTGISLEDSSIEKSGEELTEGRRYLNIS